MSNLDHQGLFNTGTIELNGEIEAIFDATIALERLDEILEAQIQVGRQKRACEGKCHQGLVETFQQELGRL